MNSLDLSLLEKYPHIHKAVTLMWGTKELYTYINNILLSTRDGARMGFPNEVASLLIQILELNYIEDSKSSID